VGLLNLFTLAADEPERVGEEIAEAMKQSADLRFQLQHYWRLVAEVQTDLYTGDGAAALGRIEALWPTVRRALILRTQFFRVGAHDLRARAALAAAAHLPPAERGGLLSSVRADVAEVAKERMTWSEPLVLLRRAGLRFLEGDATGAAAHLDEAARALDAVDMALHAACARRRRAELASDAAELARADAWMVAHGVRNPSRMTALYVPGFG
jgi:hypothetical protein